MLVLLIALAIGIEVSANTPYKPVPPPEKLILCPNNEIWINCKAAYCKPQNCKDQKTVLACPQVADPCPGGCICKDGYLRDENGLCVPIDQCPRSESCPDPNAVRNRCAIAETCRPTCAVPSPKVCPRICVIDGCECKAGYILSAKGGQCVQIEDCPQRNATCNGDPNAVIKVKPFPCPSTCASPNTYPCKKLGLTVGCECKPGYLKSEDNGKCILPKECPGGSPCGKNATFAPCRVNCPSDFCPVNDAQGIIACDPPYPCRSGCVCNLNYKRKSDSDDTCILATECPRINCTRPNEIWASCPSPCLRDNCADVKNQFIACKTQPYLNCQPQCICKKGHFRNDQDICVPANECPQPCSDPNAEKVECASYCQPTCASPNPGPCILTCILNGCVCKNGFILSEKGGKCIPVDECPRDAPCNGDANAVIKANPIPCPSTCASPYAQPWCDKYAPEVGCECKPGYIKSEDDFDGKCIEPDTCPGGNPCGVNGTFVWCNVGCPPNNCPESDSRAIIDCSAPFPCSSGCTCKLNYRKESATIDKCILASDCPAVNCTRPNEVWSPCPSGCLRETCADVNDQPTTCNTLVLNCQPQCICKKGHFRNDSDICIPAKQCPNYKSCSDPNAERVECAPPMQCRSTCATPDPEPCILSSCANDCVCKSGFVLSEKGGKCVPADQCPIQNSCNGDPNAVIKECPLPCPATCDAPNARPCKKRCVPVGCECKDGFILSKTNGQCIRPEKCKCGYPCGTNETFVPCKVNCPSDYCPVNNSPNRVICETPNPCYPGCVCKINYRRRSIKDPTCMYASECPPVKCDKNEEWSSCPSACLAEDCSNVNDPPAVCNTLLLNCQPKCICKKGYFRDSNRVCIPAKQCPKPIQCKTNEVYKPCRIICPPQTCASIYSDYDCRNATRCEPGCDCIPEYLRNGTENDLCIPSSQCPGPTPACGPNEHYEVNRCKCDLTCKNKDREALIGSCPETSGCFCDDGFYRNTNGKCVTKKQCPKITCPPNEVLSECYNTCHTTCKTRIRGDGKVCPLACLETGCLCKPDYLRHDNGTCVPVNQCSPPRCNENETYTSCGTACPETCQNRGSNCTACTEQCVEGCFCNKGFVRADDNETCVKPKDCPPRTCSDPNEVFDKCPPTCPPGDSCSKFWSKFDCSKFVKCCKPQCWCKPGYLRKNGKCVPSKQCTQQ